VNSGPPENVGSLASESWCGPLTAGNANGMSREPERGSQPKRGSGIAHCLACCSYWAASCEKAIRFKHDSKSKRAIETA